MKDLGKTKYCLGLQLEHRSSRILVHQSAYIQKILKKFNMDKSYPNKTLMVVRSLEIGKDPFRPRDIGGKDIGTRNLISQCHWRTYVSCKLHHT